VEIDLVMEVIEFSAKQRWAIEIKRSLSDPRLSKGFYIYIGCDDLKVRCRIVLYQAYPLDAETEVMPVKRSLTEKLGLS
jgi:hypothetical protein